jgi:hypothetical protein
MNFDNFFAQLNKSDNNNVTTPFAIKTLSGSSTGSNNINRVFEIMNGSNTTNTANNGYASTSSNTPQQQQPQPISNNYADSVNHSEFIDNCSTSFPVDYCYSSLGQVQDMSTDSYFFDQQNQQMQQQAP